MSCWFWSVSFIEIFLVMTLTNGPLASDRKKFYGISNRKTARPGGTSFLTWHRRTHYRGYPPQASGSVVWMGVWGKKPAGFPPTALQQPLSSAGVCRVLAAVHMRRPSYLSPHSSARSSSNAKSAADNRSYKCVPWRLRPASGLNFHAFRALKGDPIRPAWGYE